MRRKWAGGIRESDRIGTPPPPKPNKIFYILLKAKVLWLLFKQESQVDRTGGWEWMREAKHLSRCRCPEGTGKKAYFPKHIFITVQKAHPPLFVPPTQPPRKLYTVCWARVTEGFCLAPCPQAELSAPSPFIRRRL